MLPTRALAAVAAAGAGPYGTPGPERGARSARLLEIKTSRADGRTIVRTASERPGEPTTFVVLGAGAGRSSGEDGVIVDAERIAALLGTDPRIPEDPADTVGEQTSVRLSKNDPHPAASPPTTRWGVFTATRTDTGSSDVLSLPDWTWSILEPESQSKRRRAEGPQEKPRFAIETATIHRILGIAVSLAEDDSERSVRITVSTINDRGTVEIETGAVRALVALPTMTVLTDIDTRIPTAAAAAFVRSSHDADIRTARSADGPEHREGDTIPGRTTIGPTSITHEIHGPGNDPKHRIVTAWTAPRNGNETPRSRTLRLRVDGGDRDYVYRVDRKRLQTSLRRAAAMTGNKAVEIDLDSGTIIPWARGQQPRDRRAESQLSAGISGPEPDTRPETRGRRISVRPDTMAKIIGIFEHTETSGSPADRPTLLLHVHAEGAEWTAGLLSGNLWEGTVTVHRTG